MNLHFIIITEIISYQEKLKKTLETIEAAKLANFGINYSIGKIIANNRQEEIKALKIYLFENTENIFNCWNYICLIPAGSLIYDNLGQLIKGYIVENEIKPLYMPLIELAWYINKNDIEPQPKGFLNTCLWKPYLQPEEIGYLDFKLAQRQIDTTLYGCLIPTDVLPKVNLDDSFKFFYQFNLINQIANTDTPIIGIPKCFLFLVHDYELKDENMQEKKEEFIKAKIVECSIKEKK
jgi:hypothetical protein